MLTIAGGIILAIVIILFLPFLLAVGFYLLVGLAILAAGLFIFNPSALETQVSTLEPNVEIRRTV